MTLHGKNLARAVGAGLILIAAGWLTIRHTLHDQAGFGLLFGGITLLALLLHSRRRAAGSAGLIGRWDRHARRNAGTASMTDIWRTSSWWAMRRRAAVIRPSLAGLRWWKRWRVPLLTFAVPLAKAGRQTVWTSAEESTLRIGIPGTGKTAEMANRVIDAPGGVVVTSTATDLYELTAPLRCGRGPVRVFNPGGLGGLESSLRWSPLAGCTDPATAVRRATDLMGPAKAGTEAERWAIQARRVLAVWLHAAALGTYRMADLQAWCADPDTAREDILTALKESPQAAAMRQAAAQSIDMSTRTRDGVMLAMAPALAWTTLPSAAQAGDADLQDAAAFTVAELTDHAGTLYLLGDDDGTVGPLVGALVAEVAYQARHTAAARPGGRLDPGMAFVLDELALVCPTPVDRWMAELRKRSIAIHAACQGLGQLRERWGADGASMILNSAAAVLVFGGCKDAADLRAFVDLAGEREETTPTRDAGGRVTSTSTRRVPVIAPAMLAGLPNFHALLIRRGMRVALVRTPIVWTRRDVRRAMRTHNRISAAPVAERSAAPATGQAARRPKPRPDNTARPVRTAA